MTHGKNGGWNDKACSLMADNGGALSDVHTVLFICVFLSYSLNVDEKYQ